MSADFLWPKKSFPAHFYRILKPFKSNLNFSRKIFEGQMDLKGTYIKIICGTITSSKLHMSLHDPYFSGHVRNSETTFPLRIAIVFPGSLQHTTLVYGIPWEWRKEKKASGTGAERELDSRILASYEIQIKRHSWVRCMKKCHHI